jgi:hypothetical protein
MLGHTLLEAHNTRHVLRFFTAARAAVATHGFRRFRAALGAVLRTQRALPPLATSHFLDFGNVGNADAAEALMLPALVVPAGDGDVGEALTVGREA